MEKLCPHIALHEQKKRRFLELISCYLLGELKRALLPLQGHLTDTKKLPTPFENLIDTIRRTKAASWVRKILLIKFLEIGKMF